LVVGVAGWAQLGRPAASFPSHRRLPGDVGVGGGAGRRLGRTRKGRVAVGQQSLHNRRLVGRRRRSSSSLRRRRFALLRRRLVLRKFQKRVPTSLAKA